MARRSGPVRELLLFMKENKAYWLAPLIIVLLLLAALLIFGGGTGAPFIYTLF